MEDSDNVVTLDVREDLRAGRPPLARILDAVGCLGKQQQLRLLAPFEPAPLYAVLHQQGFEPRSREMEQGDWEVLFVRRTETRPPLPRSSAPESMPGEVVELDARGLEPPQPLVAVLEALESLPSNACLRAHTDRRPMHLYPMLEERGFGSHTHETDDGSYVTEIRHL